MPLKIYYKNARIFNVFHPRLEDFNGTDLEIVLKLMQNNFICLFRLEFKTKTTSIRCI